MVEIDLYIYKVLHWNISVQHQCWITIHLQYHVSVMQCLTLFLSDDSQQDTSTTTAHSKRLISLLNNKKVLKISLSTIWENTDGFAEQYRCASELYLISLMSQTYSIIIDRGISEPGHGKEVVYGLNAVDKRLYISIDV